MSHHFPRHFIPVFLLLVFSSLTASLTLITYQEIIENPIRLPEADRLVMLLGVAQEPEIEWPGGWNTGAFTDISVFQTANLNIGEDAHHLETVLACLAGKSFFDVLSVGPERGRLLSADDEQIGAVPVAVVSDAFWRSHLGSIPNLSDAKFFAAGHWIKVVGVLPASVDFPAHSVIYLPHPSQSLYLGFRDGERRSPDDPSGGYDTVIGRLRPGATVSQAGSMVRAINEHLRKINTDPHRGFGDVGVRRLRDTLTFYVKGQLTTITVAGFFVALVALFSLFFLSAARAAEQRKDMAIRVALGATTSSLLRREVVWWLWVGFSASAAVLVCTELAFRSMREMEALAIPRLDDLSLSLPQGVFIVTGTVCVALLLALPYYFACRKTEPVAPILNRGESQTRLNVHPVIGKIVSVGQLSLALALTAIALVVCVNFWRLATTAPGIDPSGVFVSQPILASALNLGNFPALPGSASAGSRSPGSQSSAANPTSKQLPGPAQANSGQANSHPGASGSASTLGDLFQSVLKPLSQADRAARGYAMYQETSRTADEVSRQPGVAGVALVPDVPYEPGAGGGYYVDIPASSSGAVIPTYFVRGDLPKILGIRVLAGRWFNGDDENTGANVVVIGDAFSKQFFSGHPIGKRIRVEQYSLLLTIVGVVDDVVANYGEPIGPTMYIPMTSQTGGGAASIVVKMAPGVTRAPFPIRKVPGSMLEFQGWTSMSKMMSDAGATDRASALVAAWFAALVLLLAAAGAYAVFWMLTIQRQREMAIRICFGALPSRVALGMVMNGITLAACAGVGGFVIQRVLGRVLSSNIYQFPVFSWPTFLISFAVISVATLLSVARPASSILRLSPAELLREN